MRDEVGTFRAFTLQQNQQFMLVLNLSNKCHEPMFNCSFQWKIKKYIYLVTKAKLPGEFWQQFVLLCQFFLAMS